MLVSVFGQSTEDWGSLQNAHSENLSLLFLHVNTRCESFTRAAFNMGAYRLPSSLL